MGWRALAPPKGQNGLVARSPVHSEAHPPESGDGGGGKAVDRRQQVRMVGVAVGGVLLGWFALANFGKVRIDFSKHFTQQRRTVWASDSPLVSLLLRVIMASYGQN